MPLQVRGACNLTLFHMPKQRHIELNYFILPKKATHSQKSFTNDPGYKNICKMGSKNRVISNQKDMQKIGGIIQVVIWRFLLIKF